MTYRVIRKEEFAKYRVRGVPLNAQLIIGFCLCSGDEMFCANVISVSSSLHNLIPMIKECKEKNDEFQKKISNKEK